MNNKISTRHIVLCGLLTAIAVILGGPLSTRLMLMGGLNMRLSFAVVPGIFAGMVMGPVFGFIVGFLTDLGSYFATPTGGAYMPLFSVFMGCMGAAPSLLSPLFGRLFRKGKNHYLSLVPSILISQFLFSTVGNSALISMLSGGGIFWGLVPTRLLTLLLVPVHALLVTLLIRVYARVSPGLIRTK